MAEYNVLAGDIAVLAEIRSDVKKHGEKKERLDRLSSDVKELAKAIESSIKAVDDEKESRLKSSRDAVSAGFDKAINIDDEKLKKIQNDRDRAKLKGVKERIIAETASLKEENDDYKEEIKQAFKSNKIPKLCASRAFISFFLTKSFKDILLFIASLAVLYLAIPLIVFVMVPTISLWVFIVFYFVLVTVEFSLYKYIYSRYVLKHIDTIDAARQNRNKIAKNKKKIKKIEHSIKKDKNEEMYGLEDFDVRIHDIHNDIRKIEAERDLALDEFENTAKPDIVEEIERRDRDRIASMRTDLEKKSVELTKLEELVKEQTIYISSNYEAYLGKEFATVDKLDELYAIIHSGVADTIGQAIAAYRERK